MADRKFIKKQNIGKQFDLYTPVVIDSGCGVWCNNKPELFDTVLDNNLIYYQGMFYPMNAFILADGRVQLLDAVKSNQQNYCLQIKFTYHNDDGLSPVKMLHQ